MRYYWPLVLIGGTLLVIGAALPSIRWSGGMPTFWQAASGYHTGFEHGGILWAIGGGILLCIALIERGANGRFLALVVSELCFLAIVAASVFQPICGDCPTYAP